MKYIDKEDVEYIENEGDVLACRYYHKFMHPYGVEAIGDCDSETVDNKNWDVFHIQYETKDAYYGIPMLGMCLMNCMILKSDTRPFQEGEFNYKVGVFGNYSGKCSSKYSIEIEPIVNKL